MQTAAAAPHARETAGDEENAFTRLVNPLQLFFLSFSFFFPFSSSEPFSLKRGSPSLILFIRICRSGFHFNFRGTKYLMRLHDEETGPRFFFFFSLSSPGDNREPYIYLDMGIKYSKLILPWQLIPKYTPTVYIKKTTTTKTRVKCSFFSSKFNLYFCLKKRKDI